MRITKYGHSCLHIIDGLGQHPDRSRHLLPGLRDAVRADRGADHASAPRPRRSEAATAAAPRQSGRHAVRRHRLGRSVLAEAGITATAVPPATMLDVGTPVEVFAGDHAVDPPRHPGDPERLLPDRRPAAASRRQPDGPRPAGGDPGAADRRRRGWRSRRPSTTSGRSTRRSAIPIHEKVLANPAMVYGMLDQARPGRRPLGEPGRRHFETC